jgi:uncharacterized phage protein gp47/JayE
MAVSGQGFSTFVATMVAAARAGAKLALDTSVGSITLALIEAVGLSCLWLQGLVLQVLAQSRASTSQGADLDSWTADFGFVRNAAAASTGQASFGRFQPTAQAVIPVGTLVSTRVGGTQFSVAADPTNAAYNANALGTGLGGFVVPTGVAALSVLVAAVVPAAAGNIVAGALSTILQPISGIDTVTNPSPFTGGLDPESDAAFRARFVGFIQQLFKSTRAAIGFALNSVQAGLSFAILENQQLNGTAAPGSFLIILDDGSGAPPPSLLAAAASAVNAVRALGVTFSVTAPTIAAVNVTMTLSSINAALHAADVAAVQAALAAFLGAIPVGTGLSYSRLFQVAYDASPNIAGITGYTLNGGTSDVTVTVGQVVKPGIVTVV